MVALAQKRLHVQTPAFLQAQSDLSASKDYVLEWHIVYLFSFLLCITIFLLIVHRDRLFGSSGDRKSQKEASSDGRLTSQPASKSDGLASLQSPQALLASLVDRYRGPTLEGEPVVVLKQEARQAIEGLLTTAGTKVESTEGSAFQPHTVLEALSLAYVQDQLRISKLEQEISRIQEVSLKMNDLEGANASLSEQVAKQKIKTTEFESALLELQDVKVGVKVLEEENAKLLEGIATQEVKVHELENEILPLLSQMQVMVTSLQVASAKFSADLAMQSFNVSEVEAQLALCKELNSKVDDLEAKCSHLAEEVAIGKSQGSCMGNVLSQLEAVEVKLKDLESGCAKFFEEAIMEKTKLAEITTEVAQLKKVDIKLSNLDHSNIKISGELASQEINISELGADICQIKVELMAITKRITELSKAEEPKQQAKDEKTKATQTQRRNSDIRDNAHSEYANLHRDDEKSEADGRQAKKRSDLEDERLQAESRKQKEHCMSEEELFQKGSKGLQKQEEQGFAEEEDKEVHPQKEEASHEAEKGIAKSKVEKERASSREASRIALLEKSQFESVAAWGFAVLNAIEKNETSVQTSYRNLMKLLHPDRARGMSAETCTAIASAANAVREAKDACLREVSNQQVPAPPSNFRFATLCSTPGQRRIDLRWDPPLGADEPMTNVRKYIVAVVDPSFGRGVTVNILEPDYREDLGRFITIHELTSYILAEDELQKLPALWKQRRAVVQVAAANEVGQSPFAEVIIPISSSGR